MKKPNIKRWLRVKVRNLLWPIFESDVVESVRSGIEDIEDIDIFSALDDSRFTLRIEKEVEDYLGRMDFADTYDIDTLIDTLVAHNCFSDAVSTGLRNVDKADLVDEEEIKRKVLREIAACLDAY